MEHKLRYNSYLQRHKIIFDFPESEAIREISEYIGNNPNVLEDKQWDYLLRNYNLADLKSALCLEYVLPVNTTISFDTLSIKENVAAIVHLYYEDTLDECITYISNIPNYIDVIITTSKPYISEHIKQYFEKTNRVNIQVRTIPNRGRDVAALLVNCRDIFDKYDYLCFTHDKRIYNNVNYNESARYLLWENILGSKTYIENILHTLDKETRLGFLTAPAPYFGSNLLRFGCFWDDNYHNTAKLADKLGLRCNISENKPVFSVGTAFWCRTAALKALIEYKFSVDDFPPEPLPGDGTISHAIERILPYVAQHEGYFSCTVMTDRYTQIRMIELETIIMKIMNTDFASYSLSPDLYGLTISGNSFLDIVSFCKKINDIYIYGTGMIAKRVLNLLNKLEYDISGFIVSDGYDKRCCFSQKPVYWLSDVDLSEDNCGVILGLGKENSGEVMQHLKNMCIQNIFCVYEYRGK